ncbi:putative porin [Flavobacterium sp.]|uniref:putative porin n=1 Tax=Flavobacterium sp. TaxID=239 RepID=UPI002B4B74D8|nr:putative porin [Flavobacterium sp.]HLF52764.1 putative porin [Flavobacterium sp.]
MRIFFLVLIFFFCSVANAQVDKPEADKLETKAIVAPKATIDQYRIITLERDTTFVDTSLTIQKEYDYNYLRKDNFGLLPFANEGQTYNTLQFSLNQFSPYPEFGYKAKHFNYLEANQIKYYSVATPSSELYFKTVMEQGQNLDAFITLNTSKRFNFSIAYKGLRSIGKYINQLSSTGNFRFTSSYNTLNKRYYANFHFTAQDILNGENGGITTIEEFEGDDADFKNRARLNVYFKDAKSFLKGKRVFLDHSFMINSVKGNNNLYLTHQFNYENKFFEFNQKTIPTTIVAPTGNTSFNRLGDAYVTGDINNQTRYNKMYNKVGAVYENATLGKFQFFIDDFRYNYYYNSVLFLSGQTIPNSLNDRVNSIGGQYEYRKDRWNGKFLYSNSISDQSLFNLDGNLTYKLNEKNSLSFQYQNINKLPNYIYNLHQSSYISYNWYNNFKNEKINNIKVDAITQWANASLQITTLNDHLYFSNDDDANLQLVSPKQYNKSINYLSLKVSKEFKFRKFALDNTVLYQKTDQTEAILNVPQIVTRNTLYYSTNLFKKAMYLQTGVIFNYFTKYNANDYNPVIGEFFVQNQKEIGNFPTFDFFINARVRQTRIFLKAEHFNSSMTGNDFYSAPNYPYRDFIVRFGLVWNFFQ